MGEGEIYQVSAHVPFLLIVKHTVGKFATDTWWTRVPSKDVYSVTRLEDFQNSLAVNFLTKVP